MPLMGAENSNASKAGGRGRNYDGPYKKTPGRLSGMALIRLYQLTLSGFIGNSCRHLPTCSEFAYEAIARHGLWCGGWMGFFRVIRCGPGGTHGYDPVPGGLPSGLGRLLPWKYIHYQRWGAA